MLIIIDFFLFLIMYLFIIFFHYQSSYLLSYNIEYMLT